MARTSTSDIDRTTMRVAPLSATMMTSQTASDASVDYSRVKVRDVEAGKPVPLVELKGSD
jgi:hypothetical protein